jgi:hypothetical protein
MSCSGSTGRATDIRLALTPCCVPTPKVRNGRGRRFNLAALDKLKTTPKNRTGRYGMSQTISELTEKENTWVAEQVEAANKFVDSFSPTDSEKPLNLASLDRAFKAWIATEPSDVDRINDVINAVGIAFGRFLVEGAGLRWVIATDEGGSDLAVFGLPGTADVLVYPANLVAKRWERRETDFLVKLYGEISGEVRSLRAQLTGKVDKPWWRFW